MIQNLTCIAVYCKVFIIGPQCLRHNHEHIKQAAGCYNVYTCLSPNMEFSLPRTMAVQRDVHHGGHVGRAALPEVLRERDA